VNPELSYLIEQHIVPPRAVIANAIHAAVCVRMNILPMSPTHILEALWERGE
jgi:CO/xanthine dehydrogenase Mo-binding subunit